MFYCLMMEVAMKLHKLIKQKLLEHPQDTVIKQMGYGSLKVGRKTLKALMLVSARSRVFIHKESLVYKTDEDVFQNVGKMIRKHYAEYKGELPVLGKIVHYLYEHSDGNTYKFTIEGGNLR